MARLLFILACAVCLINQSHAVSFETDQKSCDKLRTYTGMDAGFESAVSAASGFIFLCGRTCISGTITSR
jgi:hypothetical protein